MWCVCTMCVLTSPGYNPTIWPFETLPFVTYTPLPPPSKQLSFSVSSNRNTSLMASCPRLASFASSSGCFRMCCHSFTDSWGISLSRHSMSLVSWLRAEFSFLRSAFESMLFICLCVCKYYVCGDEQTK